MIASTASEALIGWLGSITKVPARTMAPVGVAVAEGVAVGDEVGVAVLVVVGVAVGVTGPEDVTRGRLRDR